MSITTVMFSKKSDEWETPKELFRSLHKEFSFGVDAAASKTNTQCEVYLGPGGNATNALTVSWAYKGAVWLNPPYSQCRQFIAKAAAEARKGCTVVCLVPSRTDTQWWHEHVWDGNSNQPNPGVSIRFIKGRLKFGTSTNSAPFPSVVIVFSPNRKEGV